MSAQARYTTLLKHTTSIYSAVTDRRTTLLHKGLDDIVAGICPVTPADWAKVRLDSNILLRIWATKENDSAAVEVLNQLLSFLETQALPAPAPTLVITEPVNDKILHIKEYPSDDESEEEEEEKEAKVVVIKEMPVPVNKGYPQQFSSRQAEAEAEADAEVEEEAEAALEVEVEEEEVEEEVEEEEVEEEVEEEEEDGLEVEPYVHRGRKFWRDTNGKVYANLPGDEVGDEIGEIVNGKLMINSAP